MTSVHRIASTPPLRLGYLRFAVRRPERWAPFAASMLGLGEPIANDDGSLGYALDDAAAQRLIVAPGASDDLSALGIECGDDAVFDGLVQRLRQAAVSLTPGDAAMRCARRVRRLVRAHDPAGNAVELFVGMDAPPRAFASPHFPGGFRTGALGLGHAALISHDIAAMERFYVDLLGFRVSERLEQRIGPIEMKGVFLHCNRRHHTLAVFDLPLRKRLHHFMIEANDIADVGTAFERAQATKVPLSLDLGQHPDPDGTFSFYGSTPSGFDFEIGAGGKQIEPERWRERRAQAASHWGHKPRLRLQWKMAKELLVHKLAM